MKLKMALDVSSVGTAVGYTKDENQQWSTKSEPIVIANLSCFIFIDLGHVTAVVSEYEQKKQAGKSDDDLQLSIQKSWATATPQELELIEILDWRPVRPKTFLAALADCGDDTRREDQILE